MVASVLFIPTSIDEELHLTLSKSLSSTSDDDAVNCDFVLNDEEEYSINDVYTIDDDDDDDDTTIIYNNTTTAHTMNLITRRQQQQQQQNSVLEEQRMLQISPSSVVSNNSNIGVLGGIVSNTTCTSNIITGASIVATDNSSGHTQRNDTPLSIPKLKNDTRSSVPVVPRNNVVASNTSKVPTSSTMVKTEIVQKPFFIFDFLDDIDPTVLAIVQQTLQQQELKGKPYHKRLPSSRHHNCTSASSADDILGDSDSDDLDSNHFILLAENSVAVTTTMSFSPFLLQSIERVQQYHNRGIVAAQQGEWNKALRYWFDALEIRNQLLLVPHSTIVDSNNRNKDMATTASLFNFDVTETYHNIGITYGKLEQYDTALQYLHQALEMRMESVSTIAAAAAAAVVVNDDEGKTNTGLMMTMDLQQIQRQQQQQLHMDIASSFRTIGDMYQKQNELSLAIQFYIKCKLLQEELLLPTPTTMIDMARTCVAIGHSFAMGQAYSDAYEAYHDAIAIYHQLGTSSEIYTDMCIEQYYSEYQATLSNLRLMEQKK